MILTDTNQFIKDNLDQFIKGDFNDKFDIPSIERLIELSFLLNHVDILDGSIIFKYEKIKIKINLVDRDFPYSEEEVVHYIKSEDVFKQSFKSFIRDWKIGNILSESI